VSAGHFDFIYGQFKQKLMSHKIERQSNQNDDDFRIGLDN